MRCPHCSSPNVIGPFEMDGRKNHTYQRRGLWWLVCRGCHKSTNVPEPVR